MTKTAGQMRFVIQTLLASAIVGAPLGAGAARPAPNAVVSHGRETMPDVAVGATWAPEAQPDSGADPGFSPLSVTQSGVAYSPPAPAFDPAASNQAKIADLPAWASSYFATSDTPRARRLGTLGLGGPGGLSEPAAWVLILVGMAMICGALRGLIVANRRLARLRSEDETPR